MQKDLPMRASRIGGLAKFGGMLEAVQIPFQFIKWMKSKEVTNISSEVYTRYRYVRTSL